jgi:hypothetical protein
MDVVHARLDLVVVVVLALRRMYSEAEVQTERADDFVTVRL